MKNALILFVCLPLMSASQENAKPFRVSGTLKNLEFRPDMVYLQYQSAGEWVADSSAVQNGKYSFSGRLTEPALARFRVKYKLNGKGSKVVMNPARDLAAVFIQPGKIRVTAVDSFSHITVKGSAVHKEYMTLKVREKPYEEKMKPLIDKYREFAKAKDLASQNKTEEEIDAIEKEKNEKIYGEFVKQNPSSPLAMYALKQFAGYAIDAEKTEPLYNALSQRNKNYPSAIRFREELEIAKITGIGKMAPDFTQQDTLGIPVSLSSLRGQYVLIDFWASWCGPCRAENPNLVKVFNQYKNRHFHILGVSLDREGQREKWMKAIHDDKLGWTQVSDLRFWQNEVARQYGIQAIPQNLLLDPTGKIIAKNLSGEELESKLAEVLR